MTTQEKLDGLLKALAQNWDPMFCNWHWEEVRTEPGLFVLSGKDGPYHFVPYLAGCRDAWSSRICMEYNPEQDRIRLVIRERPIQAKFKDDLLGLFQKYAPFGMELTFDALHTPTMSRQARVAPEEFAAFLMDFRKAYDEYYPVFYMVTVCATEWYDGFGLKCYDWGANNYWL